MSDELLALIFIHLPVFILMRLRCVSKQFRDLIDNPYFANVHLRHSVRNHLNRNILCRSMDPDLNWKSVGLHCVEIDTLRCFEPKCPGGRYNSSTQLIGMCNDIVLFYDQCIKEITFWNPAIRTYIDVILPRVSIPQGSFYNHTYNNLGFGYDHVNDHYKVVMTVQWYRTTRSNGAQNDKEVHVYSLKSNSWRRIGNFPYSVNYGRLPATFANGALFWMCSEETVESNHGKYIAAFELATEEYRVVPALPAYHDTSCNVDNYIGSMEGFLCVQCYVYHPECDDELAEMGDIWLLQRDGEEDTWTKLVSFNRPSTVYQPLAFSKSGNHLLLASQEIFLWYDLVKEEVREEFRIRGLPQYYELVAFIESLVHLDGGTSAEENQLIREKKVAEDDESDEGNAA
ncbi:F-box protein CPR1-like [Apium graveolens]|uniref:F-box protein CPR1-like n=1 Tax=Apium graveolens TaxID=4045 RepID=UPI003D7A6F45